MGSKINNIVSKLLVKVLTLIIWEPDYKLINDIIQILYLNDATLTIPLVRGVHEPIGVILNPILYTTIL